MKDKFAKYKIQIGVSVLFFLCIGVSIGLCIMLALPWWQEREDLHMQTQTAIEKTKQLQQFAQQHKNYDEEYTKKQKELEALIYQLPVEMQADEIVSVLQQNAVTCNVTISEVQPTHDKNSASKPTAKKQTQSKKMDEVRFTVKGDYFALMQWLTMIEQQKLHLSHFEMSTDDKNGNVKMTAVVRSAILS